MDTLRSAFAGITALICILSAASCSTNCGFDDDNGMEKNSSQTADKVMDRSYSSVEIDTELPVDYLQSFSALGDTGKFFICGGVSSEEGYRPVMYVTDADFLTFDELTYELPKGDNIESYYQAVVSNSGKIFLLTTVVDYGDAERPDYGDPDFDYGNFDYEAMWEAADITYGLVSMGADGNILSETDIKGIERYEDNDRTGSSIYEIYPIGDDAVMVSVSRSSDTVYLAVDSDGKLSEPIDFDGDDYLYPAGNDINGNFVYITYDGSDNVIRTLDASTLTLSPDDIRLKDAGSDENYIDKIFKGSGDYTLFLSGQTSLGGLKADGTVEEIINWRDSDINGSYISGVIPLEDGDFAVYENDTDGFKLSRLTKRDPSELANIKVINIAASYTDDNLNSAIQEFNKSNTEYRIRVDEYDKYYEWDEDGQKSVNTPEKQLKQDLATGKRIDMIYMPGNALIKNLSNKGVLVDLYEYMGRDGTISKDDIVEPVLRAGEVNGRLTSISQSFNVETLACKTKYCDIENWTLDDMISAYENLPDEMKFFNYSNTKKNVFYTLEVYWTSFVDYENAKCDFNDPEFISLLEFCNRFSNEGEGDDINWETAAQDEIQAYWEEQEIANLNDKALLRNVYINNVREYAHVEQVCFGDDITFVGYPSADGKGARLNNGTSISIMANSQYKDVCWQFISSLFDEKYQYNEDETFYLVGLPALRTAFEKSMDSSMSKPYYIDESGRKIEYDRTYTINGKRVTVSPLTKEKREHLEQYILSADTNSFFYDNDLRAIIDEETDAYFAGEKSAEETASIIQNRASILISEQS